ncbi:hypothetical protein Sjap_017082 [Stephania japonica]|uniref:TF-B3 domain-containing protein n=1 Tax=Stephania japonica TaxID=461633 RepID=A0AAP0I5H2_9MAGN
MRQGQRRQTGATRSFYFFKIVSPAAIANRRLGLPKKFIREFGRNLSDVAVLKVPTGKDWQIKLINENGDIFLQQGWQQFKEQYSISAGHFLVFRYEGNSIFHVLIFNMSGSEIRYVDNSDKTTTHVRRYKKSNTVDSVKTMGASAAAATTLCQRASDSRTGKRQTCSFRWENMVGWVPHEACYVE